MTLSITLDTERREGGFWVGEAEARPATWRSLLADGEFRTLWSAQAVSTVGDQLARVALTVLVFDRTKSAFLTAAVIGITYLPWILGGPLLGGLADKFPRRSIMIVCNLMSALLIGLMAFRGVALGVLCALLFFAVLLEPLFSASRSALLADVLPDDRYVLANALGNVTTQTGQVVGFAAGGIAVGVLGPQTALVVDAGTFFISAVMLSLWVRDRPGASVDAAGTSALRAWWERLSGGAQLVFRDPKLRTLLIVSWLALFYVVPEGLAAPYVDQLYGDHQKHSVAIGLILAAQPLGVVIGGLLLSRLVPQPKRLALLVPLAALSSAPMMLIGLTPGLVLSVIILAVTGLGGSYQIVSNSTFVQSVSPERRGQAYGLATAGLIAGQGLGLLLGGAIASQVPASAVIAGSGLLGTLTLLAVSGVGRRVFASTPPSPVPH
jgi:MFS family permease